MNYGPFFGHFSFTSLTEERTGYQLPQEQHVHGRSCSATVMTKGLLTSLHMSPLESGTFHYSTGAHAAGPQIRQPISNHRGN